MAVTTYTWMSASDVSTDAAFRKWVQGLDAAFVNNGWVQTADTGQTPDLTTITVPSTTNTAATARVYRLADAGQATAPIFVKLECGKGSSGWSMWVTIGQSTNGASTIGNVLLARVQAQGTSDVTERASYSSGDGSSLCLSLWPGSSNSNVMLIIERSRDTSGNATTEAFLIATTIANPIVRVIGNGGVVGAVKCADTGALGMLPYTINGVTGGVGSTLSKDGVTAPVLPIACLAPGVTPWVSNVVTIVHPGDAATTSVIQAATINGATRTYRAAVFFDNASLVLLVSAGAIQTHCRPAILWAV